MQTAFAIRQNFTMCNVQSAFSDIAAVDSEYQRVKYRFELCINVINRQAMSTHSPGKMDALRF